MSRGDETREHILRQAAGVFNRLGYAGASVSDLEEATGLRTGGIYRHFPGGKEALALEAFRYAVHHFDERFEAAAATPGDAIARLNAVVAVYRRHAVEPPVPGGCPVMNAAIEHDAGGSAELRRQARRAMDRWRGIVRTIVADGQARREIRKDAAPETVASMVLATMEGAIMLAGLYRDPAHVERAAEQLSHYLEGALRS
ncbi:MAG TPA: TetR/AcrR family transcriptional regulator [Gemmatimonadaceae bacterium]|nr:TetR/AcrR family transcriptional regulator [Gemmatimonadaceae bacterium]